MLTVTVLLSCPASVKVPVVAPAVPHLPAVLSPSTDATLPDTPGPLPQPRWRPWSEVVEASSVDANRAECECEPSIGEGSDPVAAAAAVPHTSTAAAAAANNRVLRSR